MTRAALTRPSRGFEAGREPLPAGSGDPMVGKLAIGIEKVDAGDNPRRPSPAREYDAGLRVEKLKGREARGSALPWFCGTCPPGAGCYGRQHKIPCRNDNQAAQAGFGGAEDAEHGAVGWPWQARNGRLAHKPQHDEEGFHDPCKHFAVAFDCVAPVHVRPILQGVQNRNTLGMLGI